MQKAENKALTKQKQFIPTVSEDSTSSEKEADLKPKINSINRKRTSLGGSFFVFINNFPLRIFCDTICTFAN